MFKNHFPEYYNKDLNFKKGIVEVLSYINKKVKEIDNLETIEITKNIAGKNKKFTFIQSNKVNKLFRLNSVVD